MYIVQALIADHQAPTLVVAFRTVGPHQAGATLEELVAEGELGSRGQQLPVVYDAEPVITDVGQFGFQTPLIGLSNVISSSRGTRTAVPPGDPIGKARRPIGAGTFRMVLLVAATTSRSKPAANPCVLQIDPR